MAETLEGYCARSGLDALLAQWHPERNGELTPAQLLSGSGRKVWWMCSAGHEWQASPHARTASGTGCPVCSGKTVLPGVNDLASQRPELAAQWHREKNGSLTPESVTLHSNRKAWWRCDRGHEWQTAIAARTDDASCPYCTNRKVLAGFNDLLSRYPLVAAQWHPEKNGSLTPDQVLAVSGRKFWWLGDCGHEWCTRVEVRTVRGSGCPVCSGLPVAQPPAEPKPKPRVSSRRPVTAQPGTTVAQAYPDLAAQWSSRNPVPAEAAPLASSRKYWWRCSRGHEWESLLRLRLDGSRCPYCSNQKLLPGFNDLATVAPHLVPQWNRERNGDVQPQAVLYSSQKRVWWRCPSGHEWRAMPYARTRRHTGCPYCTGNASMSRRAARMTEQR